jgi:hypothetical protein
MVIAEWVRIRNAEKREVRKVALRCAIDIEHNKDKALETAVMFEDFIWYGKRRVKE